MSYRLHARCACSGLAAPFALAGTTRQYERSRPFTLRHVFLELTLDVPNKSVHGSATLDFERQSGDTEKKLVLDAVGFELEKVELVSGEDATPAPFEYDGDKLAIDLNGKRRGKVRVSYRATPKRGLYFLTPDAKVKDRPRQVWSQCQDEDARYWFPCLDKPHVKMTSEIRVTVPAGWVALSNGEPRPVEKKKGGWTYHFALNQPHPAYLVTLVAGEFAVVEGESAELGRRKVPVAYYVPPARKRDVARSFGETPRMIELFSERTGVAFPWSRYSQVVVSDFIFGGMENTTATTLYEYALLDERAGLDVSSQDLVAHELAHQWFGDFVTCRDWSHGWLNEGFATYFEHIEREARLGRDEYDYGVAADLDAYLGEANGRYMRPIVCRDYQAPIDLFDRHLYEKGGLVLHMLRRKLGDDAFWDGVRLYLERHAHGIVETNDLMRALEEASGKSLERFFDQWVYRPGHPDLRVKITWEDGLLTVEAKQKQKTGDVAVFAYPLEVLVKTKSGEVERHRRIVTETADTLVVRLAERPRYVVFNPDQSIVGAIQVEAPADFWRHQLAEGPSAHARWSAARGLAERDDPTTLDALGRALADRKDAWMVRAEAAKALARSKSDAAFEFLKKSAHDPHPKVRRAVAEALGAFRTKAAADLLRGLAKSDRSYLVAADAARSLGRTRQPGALKDLVALTKAKSWADTQRVGALDGLARLRDEEAVPAVIEQSRYGVPTRGRRAAVSALAALSDSRPTRRHLEDLLEDHDPHFRIAVVDALVALGDTKARGALRRALEHELDGRVARRLREALRDIGEHGSADRKRLGDELESVRGELSELKSRLAKLEVKRAPHDAKSDAKPAKPKTKAKTGSKRRRAGRRP